MKSLKYIYQTLKDKKNPLYVKGNGPFICTHNKAWLGDGYYFWDSFLSNGHWWGKCYHEGEYIICEAICDYHEQHDGCFDLVGNISHFIELQNLVKELQKNGKIKEGTTLRRILNYLRIDLKVFRYKAVRLIGNGTRSLSNNYGINIILEHKKHYRNKQFIDLCPPIQICFFEKTSLNLRNYKIVFPEIYTDGFLA